MSKKNYQPFWNCAVVSSKQAESIGAQWGISPVVAGVMLHRGLHQAEEIEKFLFPSLTHLPDPNLMKGMEKAVARLMQALERQEKVLVYGDYDVDGISSTTLLVQFFRQIGMQITCHIPSRLREGYGLNLAALQNYADQGITLLITVDCGISNCDEVAFARSRHMDTIVTDHHEPPALLPDACAIINPKQPGCSYPEKNLAGVGVAFNLLIACRRALRDAGRLHVEINLRRYLDLVALGTVADVVPLVGVNRIFVSFGLEELAAGHRVGINALLEVSQVKKETTISAHDIAFKLAPRLNAAGRLDSVEDALELLLTSDPLLAAELADRLQQLNLQRRQIESKIYTEIDSQLFLDPQHGGTHVTILASADWHEGVIGIVASKIAERYFQPTMLISLNDEGMGKASGRSIPGINLLELITGSSAYLQQFGGHQMAVGFSIEEHNLADFRDHLDARVGAAMQQRELQPQLEIDGQVRLQDLSFKLLQDLEMLAPFGYGNPVPVFAAQGVTVGRATIVGKNHLRLAVNDRTASVNAIGFSMGDRNVKSDDVVDLAFTPQINVWNGSRSIQLNLKDIR
ncbi:MAG: single-stranded-DNA-specific exonuclease RecJ [Deltaproteobacteria bacterium]|nr:single-stranded-DNA-specific exonuclease RecJ [Candidatus Anaeroferrophillus wilburensis]MBN2888292.1 single-stranded-DNA-specific exonuclease RecJ [Deltaproteobacteria bacterium]